MDNDSKRVRESIRKSLIGEGAFAGMYSHSPHIDDSKTEPHEVEVTDETVGVMEYKFDPKDIENIDYVLEELKPYFEDIEVQYVGINDDVDLVSVNVKNKYKYLLDALLSHYGFNKETETWGNEMRTGKRMYSTRSGLKTSGVHGSYPMPFLLGEPGGGSFGGI